MVTTGQYNRKEKQFKNRCINVNYGIRNVVTNIILYQHTFHAVSRQQRLLTTGCDVLISGSQPIGQAKSVFVFVHTYFLGERSKAYVGGRGKVNLKLIVSRHTLQTIVITVTSYSQPNPSTNATKGIFWTHG